ncbi:MAG: molybdenum cofactor biosynthesis protein MoaE [Myxococcales bacterium]|nr:molybdenum cofactor biosynthesis protein MoaE [Myxococcales bacterium]
MASETRILPDGEALPPLDSDDSRAEEGAELIFHGRVRRGEGELSIVALHYEHYEGMAEKELAALAAECAARFEIRDITCLHRVGRVAVGEASLRVEIWSAHRGPAIEALAWFISELKQRVPIWKWAVTADGTRAPT